MQTAVAATPAAAAPPARPRAVNELVNLAAPVLELVLKLRAGVAEPSNDIRPLVDDLLRQFERGGVQLRCPPAQVRDVQFALVAFVDETVLSPQNDFPLRAEWERNPLQLVYFKVHLAGEEFFERLEAMLRDPASNVDVVEIYYLCLLLGFKGKYNMNELEGERQEILKRVGEWLRAAGRLRPDALSAHWRADDHPEAPRDPGWPLWFKIAGPALVALALITFVVLYLLLQGELTIVR